MNLGAGGGWGGVDPPCLSAARDLVVTEGEGLKGCSACADRWHLLTEAWAMTHERLMEIREAMMRQAREDIEERRRCLARAEAALARMESSQGGLTSSR